MEENIEEVVSQRPELAEVPMGLFTQASKQAGEVNVDEKDRKAVLGDQEGQEQTQTPPEEDQGKELDTEPADAPAEGNTPEPSNDSPETPPEDDKASELEAANAEIARLKEQTRLRAESEKIEKVRFVEDLDALQKDNPQRTPQELINEAEARGEDMTPDQAMAKISNDRSELERQARESARLRSQQETELQQIGLLYPRFNQSHPDYDASIADQVKSMYETVAGVSKGKSGTIESINVMPSDYYAAIDKLIQSATSIGEARANRGSEAPAPTPKGSPSPKTTGTPKPAPKDVPRTRDGNALLFNEGVMKGLRNEIFE